MSDTQHLEDALFETLLPFEKRRWMFVEDAYSYIPPSVLDEALAATWIVTLALLDFGHEYGLEARERVQARLNEAAPLAVYDPTLYAARKDELEKEGFPFVGRN